MDKFFIKQGDTSPSLRSTLQDAAGTVINLVNADVRFHMRDMYGSAMKVDASATIIDGENGIVEYAWISADTDTLGKYYGEFEVTYSDDTIETFPNNSYFVVNIIKELA